MNDFKFLLESRLDFWTRINTKWSCFRLFQSLFEAILIDYNCGALGLNYFLGDTSLSSAFWAPVCRPERPFNLLYLQKDIPNVSGMISNFQ